MKQSLILTISLLFVLGTFGQQNDSLKLVLNSTKVDTSYIKTALDISWNYMYSNSDSSEFYANKALEKAIQTDLKLLTANAFNTLGVVFIVKAQYYDALFYLSQGLEIGNQLLAEDSSKYSYKRRVLAIYTNIGNINYFQGNYDESVSSYLKALKLSEDIGFHQGAAVSASNLGSAYKDLYNYPKALEYNYIALAYAVESGDSFALSQSYNNLGSVYFSIPDYDSSYYYFMKSIRINEEGNDEYELINNYVNMGDVMRDIGKSDSALYYYRKSLNLSHKLQSVDGLINCNYMIGQLYHKKKDYKQGIDYYKKSLELANSSGVSRFIMLSSEQLAFAYEEIGDFKNAYHYFTEAILVRDSIFHAESDERIADMEAKYRTVKTQEELKLLTKKTELQEAKAKVTKIVYVGVIIILALSIILIIISYRSYRLKQLSERQRIQQDTEKKLLDTIIETENKERRRFAEDLHDGLGVQLSTLRLYVNELSENMREEERTSIINQSNSLLDDAISNARSISNNIMPASLKDAGLYTAIRNAGDKINSSGGVKVDIKSINFQKHYKSSIEITLYRVLNEMLNNTLKHGDAANVNIVLSEKGNKLIVTYKDDGKGFNYEETVSSQSKGMGLDNIISRISSINGNCKLSSSRGKGFTALIEVIL